MGEREKEDREVVGKMNGEGEKEGMGWRRRVGRRRSTNGERRGKQEVVDGDRDTSLSPPVRCSLDNKLKAYLSLLSGGL
jgi:hypothetical protein